MAEWDLAERLAMLQPKSDRDVDPEVLKAWLSARSIVRGLPLPIPDRGDFRIDTKSDAEIAIWVFPKSNYALERRARSISSPRYF